MPSRRPHRPREGPAREKAESALNDKKDPQDQQLDPQLTENWIQNSPTEPGQRLAEERKQRGLTQAQLAETMGVTPGRVSQIERGELSTIEAIARYVQALGGHLELVANFADHTLTVTTTEAA